MFGVRAYNAMFAHQTCGKLGHTKANSEKYSDKLCAASLLDVYNNDNYLTHLLGNNRLRKFSCNRYNLRLEIQGHVTFSSTAKLAILYSLATERVFDNAGSTRKPTSGIYTDG
jgi:hypothetical protein